MRAILPFLLAVSLPLSAAPLHGQFLPPMSCPCAKRLRQPSNCCR